MHRDGFIFCISQPRSLPFLHSVLLARSCSRSYSDGGISPLRSHTEDDTSVSSASPVLCAGSSSSLDVWKRRPTPAWIELHFYFPPPCCYSFLAACSTVAIGRQ